jgi:hypothetical protein
MQFQQFRTIISDVEYMLKKHTCPVCGGSIERTDDEGDIALKCLTCGYETGFSRGFFDE